MRKKLYINAFLSTRFGNKYLTLSNESRLFSYFNEEFFLSIVLSFFFLFPLFFFLNKMMYSMEYGIIPKRNKVIIATIIKNLVYLISHTFYLLNKLLFYFIVR
jgi:magnesium-transporting ATPase (P-type)